MRILVVDDDALAGEMTTVILEDAGHTVVYCENAVEALARLGEDPGIEMVISDMNMPLLDGLELFSTLRDQRVDVPFILLTGDDPGSLRRKEPRLGVCIVKDGDLVSNLARGVAMALVQHGS
ncbi:MAG: response regulator [Alphaproteobacteria bacterium]